MPEYPFNSSLQEISADVACGNFGLWYNKFVPLNDFNECKASDVRGDKEKRHAYYETQYDRFKKGVLPQELLLKKHCSQIHFCTTMEERGYDKLVFKAELRKPLITGLGESHPSETSLVFDHTLGIPYIPASGVKGVIRFSHSLNLLFDEDGNYSSKFVVFGKNSQDEPIEILNEADRETWIPQIFGCDNLENDNKIITMRGQVIFLDAYPETVPELHVDIINPHYKKYHGGENEAPGDYCDPEPIKFLTIAKNSSFVFRVLVPKEISLCREKIKKAFYNALEDHGLGAKTAIGYGRFFPPIEQEPLKLKDCFKAYLDDRLSPEQKLKRKVSEFVAKINGLEKETNEVDRYFDLWQQDQEIKKNRAIATALKAKVRKKKGKAGFTQKYKTLALILGVDLTEKKLEQFVGVADDQKKPLADDLAGIQEKLERIIARGYISRGQSNKILENHKKEFPELCAKIKKLPRKKA